MPVPADQLAIVPRSEGFGRGKDKDGFEEVGLPGSIGTVKDGDAGGEAKIEIFVGPKMLEFEPIEKQKIESLNLQLYPRPATVLPLCPSGQGGDCGACFRK